MKFFSSMGGEASTPPPPANAPLTVKTADVPVRIAFLRKVYTLLTINLSITIAVSAVFASVDPISEYIVDPSNRWVTWAALGVALAAFLALACMKNIRFPANFILMYVFVAAFSVFIGVIVAFYFERNWGGIVLNAFIATATVFLVITIYCFITKKDFSFLYSYLAAGSIVLIILIIFSFAFTWGTGTYSRGQSFVISLVGALLMTGYLLFDTSMVMTRYGPDDWLMAVISLYIDVTQLFLFLLNIFSFAST